jgi:N-acetylglucosaminyl-diphospho-decaprenol L-rhamnosyltransferase
MTMPRCSVIVVTYDSSAHIEACLRALASQDCEIIVVDNASQDDTTARVCSLEEQLPLQLITISRNVGFAGGVHQGARAAASDVLLILNPDAIAEPNAIDALLACFAATGASAVGGALLESNGQPARGFAFRRLPTLTSLSFEVLLVNRVWPGNPVNRWYRCLDADYSRQQPVEQPAGACLAVTRKAWDSVGGMDADFFPVWFEDVDFCARLRSSGATIVYCPTAHFHHSGAHSVGQLEFRDRQMFWYQNMGRYAAKRFSAAKVMALRLAILAGMGLRTVACLIGSAPRGVPLADAIRSYARVALWAIGLGGEAGDRRAQ